MVLSSKGLISSFKSMLSFWLIGHLVLGTSTQFSSGDNGPSQSTPYSCNAYENKSCRLWQSVITLLPLFWITCHQRDLAYHWTLSPLASSLSSKEVVAIKQLWKRNKLNHITLIQIIKSDKDIGICLNVTKI